MPIVPKIQYYQNLQLLTMGVFQNVVFSGHASALRNNGDPQEARPDGTNVKAGPTVQGAVKQV